MHINSKLYKKRIWLLVGLIFSAGQANAEDPVDTSIIFMSATLGYYDFDSDRYLDNREFGGLSLGLHFNRQWSASLFYSRSHPESTVEENHRFENYYVQGKYYWMGQETLRPYLVFGLGEILQGEGKVSSETTLHSGVGVHWVIDPKWALQADWRYMYSFDDSNNDQTLMTTIVYRFGEGER